MTTNRRIRAGRWLAGLGLVAGLVLTGCSETEPEMTVPTTAAPAVSTTSPTAQPTTAQPTSAAPVVDVTTEPPHTESVDGQIVRVLGIMDGDTLRVSVDGVTERLRIIGIDAPELRGNECYAQKSASKMQSLVQSTDVRIVADPTQADRDRYDRILRHVFTLDGTSVGHAMILEGLAKEYTYDKPYASQAEYLEAEEVARAAGLGVWGACDIVEAAPTPTAAVPVAPQEPAPPAAETTGACLIKGNINRKKEKIYHVPGQRHYDETIIDEFEGEAWFCTEQEAVDAGWRKSKR